MSSPKIRERHIDRIFAEEMESSKVFASWFTQQALGKKIGEGNADSCDCRVGYHRLSGETDIFASIEWSDGATIHLHVEDKIEANPQPRQAERYAEAVDVSESDFSASALIAPEAWLQRHHSEASIYNCRVSFEDIAEQLDQRAKNIEADGTVHANEIAKRLRWRANIFNGTRKRVDVRNAIKSRSTAIGISSDESLNEFNRVAAEVIEAYNGLILEKNNRQRSTGRNQPSRFFKFDEQLTPYDSGGRKPILRIKTKGTRPGRVSLDLFGAGHDDRLVASAKESGFSAEISPRGTLMVESSTPTLGKLDIGQDVNEQISAFEEAAQIAQKLIVWWNDRTQARNRN